MDDLRSAGVDFLTIGQYLAPTRKHAEVKRYVPPAEFEDLKRVALAKGFLVVASSPMTRSSYHAGEDFVPARSAAPNPSNEGPSDCRVPAPNAPFRSRRKRCSASWPTSSAIPSSCPLCDSLVVKSRDEKPEGDHPHRDHERWLQGHPRELDDACRRSTRRRSRSACPISTGHSATW